MHKWWLAAFTLVLAYICTSSRELPVARSFSFAHFYLLAGPLLVYFFFHFFFSPPLALVYLSVTKRRKHGNRKLLSPFPVSVEILFHSRPTFTLFTPSSLSLRFSFFFFFFFFFSFLVLVLVLVSVFFRPRHAVPFRRRLRSDAKCLSDISRQDPRNR